MYKSISELAQINPGNTLPSGVRPMDDVSFIPMSDVSESGEWTGRQVRSLRSVSSGFTSFADNDVLVAKITPCFENGKGTHVTNLVNGAGFGSTEFHVLRAYPGVSPRFIHHVSQSAQLRRAGEAHMVGSAGQKRVPRELFDVFKVPDFSHDEQIKISHVLDTLDTTIRQTEAIIEKLKQVKQGLLHDLLTRGIDANGELRPPQSEAPELYKESALGWIPFNWKTLQLSEVGEIVTGSTPPSEDTRVWGNDLPFVTPSDLIGDEEISVTERSVSSYGSRYVYALPPQTTVVVCIGSTIGKIGITGAQVCTNQQINAIIPAANIFPLYLKIAIQMHSSQLRAMSGLQAVPIVNKKSFGMTCIPVPHLNEQVAISNQLSNLSSRIHLELLATAKLREIKSGLMDDLLTGRVRVTPLLESASA